MRSWLDGEGSCSPPAVLSYSGEVDSYSNPVREFLMERTRFGSRRKCRPSGCTHEFDTWRHVNGLTSHGDSRWFGRSLRAAMLDLAPESFNRKQHDNEPNRPWYYHGIGLRPVENSEGTRVNFEPSRHHPTTPTGRNTVVPDATQRQTRSWRDVRP